MVVLLMRSTVTGDSRILVGVRVAATTTSWPNVLAGLKLTSILACGSVTFNSIGSKPTELITSVTGNLSTVRLNCPSELVKVPWLVPFTSTDTAGTTSEVTLFRTVPEIVMFWANAAIESRLAEIHAARKRKPFLIFRQF